MVCCGHVCYYVLFFTAIIVDNKFVIITNRIVLYCLLLQQSLVSENESFCGVKCKHYSLQLLAVGSLLQPYVDSSHWNEIRNAVKATIVADR